MSREYISINKIQRISQIGIIIIILLFSFLIISILPFFNINNREESPFEVNDIYTRDLTYMDGIGDVVDYPLGASAPHDPVDIAIIEENVSMSMVNVTFVGIPASGTDIGWAYMYSLFLDKDHDNSTAEYSCLFFLWVGGSPSCSIYRESDNKYWNGTGWGGTYEDISFSYIVGNSMIFDFSSCAEMIGDNWYSIDAYYLDSAFVMRHVDYAKGDIIGGSKFFAGGSTGPDLFPPRIGLTQSVPSVGLNGTIFKIMTNVTDPAGVDTVIANIQSPDETSVHNLTLYDDGAHNDGAANDTLYANLWNSSGQPAGTYLIDIWANDTLGNSKEVENIKLFIIGTVGETCLFDGMTYTWTGIFDMGTPTPWNGTENLQFVEGNIYTNDHYDSIFKQDIWYTDNATRLRITNQPTVWGDYEHDHLFIPKNTTLSDKLLISVFGSDKTFTVVGTKYLDVLNTSVECWELTEIGGSKMYYEKYSGLLINASCRSGLSGKYTITINSTNVPLRELPGLSILEPKNQTYYYSDVPIIVTNSTPIASMWYRNSTNGIPWSNNNTLLFNGSHFVDASLNWDDGINAIQVFANDSLGAMGIREQWFSVDSIGPWINLQSPANQTYLYRTFPIVLMNYTPVHSAFFRYDTGAGWSANSTLAWNGTHFVNESISWGDGSYHLQVFANESSSEIAMRETWYRVIATYPLNISHNSGMNMFPKIILSSPTVHIFWLGVPNLNEEIFYDHNSNGHFGNQEQLTHSFGSDIAEDVVNDPSGNLHLVWVQDSVIGYDIVYSNNTGGTFHSPVQVPSNTLYNFWPSIGVDSKNIIHIAWQGINSTTFESYILYVNNSGGTFNTPVRISSSAYNTSEMISLAIDESDTIHLAYVSKEWGEQEVIYQQIINGSVSPAENVSKRAGADITPSLAVTGSGTVHISWRGEGSSPTESEIFYINNSGGSFTAPLNVSRNSAVNDVHPCIGIDDSHDPEIVFISWTFNSTYVTASSQMQIVLANNTYGSFGNPTEVCVLQQYANASDFAIDPINRQIHIVWMASIFPTNIFYTCLNYTYPTNMIVQAPENTTYSNPYQPIRVHSNFLPDAVWYRDNTGAGWSSNSSLIFDGNDYVNQSPVLWSEGGHHFQVFANDSLGTEIMCEERFTVDSQSPSGAQWYNLTSSFFQTGPIFWINGTAFDPAPSSGFLSSNIAITATNTSASWSTNVGSSTHWAFYNLSPLQDTLGSNFYQINVSMIDNADNQFLLVCNISVDTAPPTGTQFPNTKLQAAAAGLVWINGSALDTSSGIQNVSISSQNVTGGATWSLNVGSLNEWCFYNTSTIQDTPTGLIYEVILNITDLGGHSYYLPCYFIIDTTPPSKPNVSSYITGSYVTLLWLPVTDSSPVLYMIYQDGVNVVNTTLLSHMFTNLPAGEYNFTIIAMDALGHLSAASDSVTVKVSATSGPTNQPWIWIIIIGISFAVAISTITVTRRKKKVATPLKTPIKSTPDKPPDIETERVSSSVANKLAAFEEKMKMVTEKLQTGKFEFSCTQCNKIFQSDQLEDIPQNCPECGGLVTQIIQCPHCTQPISMTKEDYIQYLDIPLQCPHCANYFKLKDLINSMEMREKN